MSTPNSTTHAVNEGPPTPAVIQSTRRETQRLIDMSRGAIPIAFGVWSLLWCLALLQPWVNLDDDLGTIGWALGVTLTATLVQQLVLQARKRAGVPNVAMRKSGEAGSRRMQWIIVFVALGVVVGIFSAALSDWLPNPGPIAFAAAVLLLVVPLVYRGWQLGLWEHYLQATGLLGGMAILWTGGRPMHLSGMCLTLGVAELIAGISLQRRWQIWVASLPPATGPGSADSGHAEVSA